MSCAKKPLVTPLRLTWIQSKCPKSNGSRRGKPFQLDWRRAIAISHVYYLWGQGIKKHVALERIGKALAVSVETLRDWEKHLAVDDWFRREAPIEK